MKKSKAVELIAKRLGPIGISEPTCEEVLEILLKAGIQPPARLKHFPKGTPENYYYPDGMVSSTWDEEESQK